MELFQHGTGIYINIALSFFHEYMYMSVFMCCFILFIAGLSKSSGSKVHQTEVPDQQLHGKSID